MVEKDIGFVMKRYNFRETSVIASLYTLRFGKVKGILKGFYTNKKEFSTTLDTFTLNEIVFYPKRSEIWLVSFADLFCDYPFVRRDLKKMKVGAIFLNVIDKTMQVWDSNPDVFKLLKESLYWLGEEDHPEHMLYIFLVKFLTLSGVKPEFNRCLYCFSPLQEIIYFSVSRGGLICQHCYRKVHDARKINTESALALLYIQKNSFPQLNRLRLSFYGQREILKILQEFLAYHLDFTFKDI